MYVKGGRNATLSCPEAAREEIGSYYVADYDFCSSQARRACLFLRIKDAFCVPVRVAGNPAQWMKLDTGCDAALEWVVSGTEKRRMGRSSIGLSGVSVRHINTSVQLGKQCFNAVTTGVHREQIFPGESLKKQN